MPVLQAVSRFPPPDLLAARRGASPKAASLRCRSSSRNDRDYLIDAPESIGDGFSFSGGKYADGTTPADEWFAQGKMVKAYPVYENKGKARDPIFGLTMGASSQSPEDVFRWFCVEAGNPSNPSVLLAHGFPSQAYSYRKVLRVLSQNYHVIAFDWLGFGFSDKPQPKYGFDYTLDEYTSSFAYLADAVATTNKLSIVVQGYFAPVVVKYAKSHQEKLQNLILVNPPITEKHVKLPSPLAAFSNFLLGEIFCQDPLRASDKAITSCGPYVMREEDAMVYRRPYLVSGSAGFALNAISRGMKKDLKAYVEDMKATLSNKMWTTPTTICWGSRDRWLSSDGVEEACTSLNCRLVNLPMAGHHVQEDRGEELGKLIAEII